MQNGQGGPEKGKKSTLIFKAPVFSEVRKGQERKFVLVQPEHLIKIFFEDGKGVSEELQALVKDACTQIEDALKERDKMEKVEAIRIENFTYVDLSQSFDEDGYVMSEILVDAAFAWLCLGSSIGLVDKYSAFFDCFPNPGKREDDPLFWDICFAMGGEEWLDIPPEL